MTGFYLALVLAVVLKAAGDALLGKGMQRSEKLELGDFGAAVGKVMHDGRVLAGIAVTALHFACYAYCLQGVDVTLANPLTSFTIVLGTLYAQFCLRERVTARRWLGVCLVTAGAMLVGTTA